MKHRDKPLDVKVRRAGESEWEDVES